MKVTVCELPNESELFKTVWRSLEAHVREFQSDVVVLPEMPFAPWLAASDDFDPDVWDSAMALHDEWLPRLAAFGEATVVGSRPVMLAGRRHNEAFTWQARSGYQRTHHKYYLPNEPGFWEETWYERGEKRFDTAETAHGTVGFLICTELWFTEHARTYGRQGAQMLICSRATEAQTTEKWVMGGRAAAVMSGAFCLSSNRGGVDSRGHAWGGHGWIIEPDQGTVLGITSAERPFLTLEIDLAEADQAKRQYPRYVRE
ncbi:MAG: carbon-nitrogen hydrolase family protein [Gammaproteobacteria bacterium]|nr:carbon-nitrogen hydrolase family protein [Gammaproteobacteria bacterium]